MPLQYDEAVARLTAPGAPFEIVEQARDDQLLKTYKQAPTSLADIWRASAIHDEQPYVHYEGRTYSFKDIRLSARRFANWLHTQGVRKGDRVAIAMRNLPDWPVVFWAVQELGAVVVAVNAWWKSDELRHALLESEPTLLVVDEKRWQYFKELGEEFLSLPCVLSRSVGAEPVGEQDLHSICCDASLDMPTPEVLVRGEDAATLLFTSGTTGQAKAAASSHDAHCHYVMNLRFFGAVSQLMTTGELIPPEQPPVMLQPFPFFHIGGMAPLYVSASVGGAMHILYKWDMEKVESILRTQRVSSFSIVPTLLRRLVEESNLEPEELEDLGGFAVGSAPVPPDLIEKCDHFFGKNYVPTCGYGLTETTGVSAISGEDYRKRLTSVGKPFPVMDVEIIDPESKENLVVGKLGEICVRGPGVIDGYWNNPSATEASFTEHGYFRTGDMGYLDEEGYLYILDRLKDVVIRGGENIYCSEVEAVLHSHPAVAEVAALGLPHGDLGEELIAVVVPFREVDEATLKEHVAASLAYFKVPNQIFFTEQELPRNPTGKVLKRQLKETYLHHSSG